MLGRVWVSVLVIATLTDCASQSRLKPFSPNLNIHWSALLAFVSSIATCPLARRTAAPLPSRTVRAASK